MARADPPAILPGVSTWELTTNRPRLGAPQALDSPIPLAELAEVVRRCTPPSVYVTLSGSAIQSPIASAVRNRPVATASPTYAGAAAGRKGVCPEIGRAHV